MGADDAIEKELGERFQGLPERLGREVEKLQWATGLDAEGESALWVWVVLRADASEAAWSWENRERIRSQVIEDLDDAGVSDWVYVRFRDAKEEPALT